MSHPSFYAEDAFAYVKIYNELVIKNIEQINDYKDDFEKRYWDGNTEDHFYYIRLRAIEHALDYKATGKSPTGMVMLNKDTANIKDLNEKAWVNQHAKMEMRIKELDQEKKELNGNIAKYEKLLKESHSREDELKNEVRRRDRALREAKTQKINLQGVYTMIFAIMLTIILLLSWDKFG
ncbi:hypothetical protein D5085_06055 [Ectothiorhodospiraceae bacterium BW-2]|nr:hypothetical protein D5085_06055 [Ectothiorhodospiraceae bacterium BW-2]